jgi:hypothetical protein
MLFDLSSAPGDRNFATAQATLNTLPPNTELWLDLKVSTNSPGHEETERELNEHIDAFGRDAPLASNAVHGLILEVGKKGNDPTGGRLAFILERLAVVAKAANPGLKIAFVFPSDSFNSNHELVSRLASYADMFGIEFSEGWHDDAEWIAREALNKPLLLRLSPRDSATGDGYLSAALQTAGTAVAMIWAQPADAPAVANLCSARRVLSRNIPTSMHTADASTLPFHLSVDGIAPGDQHWFGGGEIPEFAVVAGVHGSTSQPHSVRFTSQSADALQLEWFDAAAGVKLAPGPLIRSGNELVQDCVCNCARVLIHIRKLEERGTTAYSAIEVKSGVDLTVDEIVARWQQYSEAQRMKLENYQASTFMTLHFESTVVTAGFDVSMGFKQFFNHPDHLEMAQTELFINGVRFSNKHQFPLPQVEPSKVVVRPFELRLSEHYRYKLLGTEQINGVLCYIVSVDPVAQTEHLYSGKVWIDGTSFRQVKQVLTQRSSTSIVVNVETQNFALFADEHGGFFNLVQSVSAQQVLNAAGRDFVLQRTIRYSDYSINQTQFDKALAAAHHSDDPMFSESEKGLVRLKKQGDERVPVAENDHRISSIVAGTMYQGTFNFPIPIAGYSMTDFNFRNRGDQLSVFFAGPILASNLSKQYGPHFRLGVDLALSGLPSENRIYVGNVESKGQEVWSWEEDTGVRATWQATKHLSFTASSYLAYNSYLRTSDTDNSYGLPRNGITIYPGIELKYTRKGYVFSAQGSRGERIGWKQFGYPNLPSPDHSGFTLYNADLNKNYFIRKFTKAGWEMSYAGGDQLDRFSRYFPSFFSQQRIHGIPGGTDTFDTIAAANVHYGFNVMDLMKFEMLYSYARARNLAESNDFRRFDGLEANFNTAGPKGTLIQGTVSYALNGNIQRYNSRWGVYLLVMKPLSR